MANPAREIRPEHRLLLALLREDGVEAVRLGAVAETWSELFSLAAAHQIPTLVAARVVDLEDFGAELPEGVGTRCRDLLRQGARISFLYLQTARRCAALLAERGIPVVALKGASLARLVYPRPEQRLFKDVDLLVSRENLEEARRALTEAGFRSVLGDEQDRHFAERHFHYVLAENGGPVVELHWDLVRPDAPYRLAGAGVLERSLPGEAPGPRLESPEDHLVHAAAQVLSEGFSGLLRLCDLDAILRRLGDEIDWEGVAHTAREGRLEPTLDLLLRLAARLLGTPRPEPSLVIRAPDSVVARLEPLQPGATLVTRYTTRHRGYRQLLRFWLLPGARGTVLRHAVLRDARDRTRPTRAGGGEPSAARRLGLILKRSALVAGLGAVQIGAMMSGRREHLSLS